MKKERLEEVSFFYLEGSLDREECSFLYNSILKDFESGVRKFVIDLQATPHINSCMLKTFILLQKKKKELFFEIEFFQSRKNVERWTHFFYTH